MCVYKKPWRGPAHNESIKFDRAAGRYCTAGVTSRQRIYTYRVDSSRPLFSMRDRRLPASTDFQGSTPAAYCEAGIRQHTSPSVFRDRVTVTIVRLRAIAAYGPRLSAKKGISLALSHRYIFTSLTARAVYVARAVHVYETRGETVICSNQRGQDAERETRSRLSFQINSIRWRSTFIKCSLDYQSFARALLIELFISVLFNYNSIRLFASATVPNKIDH